MEPRKANRSLCSAQRQAFVFGTWALLLLLDGCSLKPEVVEPRETAGRGPSRAVYVVGHGWHTGIVVPGEAAIAAVPGLDRRFGDLPYLEFGWGDADFYRADEITLGVALRAVLWPTDAVMHVAAVPRTPESWFTRAEVVRLNLPPPRFDALLRFIRGSFALKSKGLARSRGTGLYGSSAFYDAEGTYFLTNTCNTWTAKGLRSAGFDIAWSTVITASGVMDYLHRVGNEGRGDGPLVERLFAPGRVEPRSPPR